MRPSCFLLLLLASPALGACVWQTPFAALSTPTDGRSSSNRVANVPATVAPGGAAVELNGAYRLDSGDRIRVVVSGQDALSNSYDVNASGAIEIPTLGAISARGLNTTQLSGAIVRRLKQNNVREPHVAVQVETFRSVSIQGGVANPGQYPYVVNMTPEIAVGMAGGFTPRADKSTVIMRDKNPGGDALVPVPLSGPVRPGDTITVIER
jgi:polysaccharide export outer membrane protein